MPKLVCLSTIQHDGMIYPVGAELEMSVEQAELLLEVRAVEVVEAAHAAASTEPAKRGRPRKVD